MIACHADGIAYSVESIGNSGKGNNGDFVQQFILDMFVGSDGTVYTNTVWDEGSSEAGIYKDGAKILNPGHTHGWGYLGGAAITANSSYLFIAQRVDSEERFAQPAISG